MSRLEMRALRKSFDARTSRERKDAEMDDRTEAFEQKLCASLTPQTAPAQTAVGEGELPPRPKTYATLENMRLVARDWIIYAEALERQLREAIVRGDAALQSQSEWKQCALDAESKLTDIEAQRDELERWKREMLAATRENEHWRSKFNNEAVTMGYAGAHYLESAYQIALRCQVAEAKTAELTAQRDEASRKGGELCSVLGNPLIHVHELGLRYADRDKFRYRNERAEAAEAKLAAAADFKPEELERLESAVNLARTWSPYGQKIIDDARKILSRLRSLPSEPQSENRKASENGK